MAARFLLLLALARIAPVSTVAEYGVLAAFLATASYFIGFDLYITTARNIGRGAAASRRLSNQIVFSSVAFVGVVAFLVLTESNRGAGYVALVCVLLGSDFLLQEIARLILATGAFRLANLLQFMRLGLWPLLAVGILARNPDKGLSVIPLVHVWVSVLIPGVIIALWMVRKALPHLTFSPSWRVFRGGLIHQLLVFSSSLSLLLLTSIDRMLLDIDASPGYLASYVFFGSLFGVIPTLIYSGLVNPHFRVLADRAIPLPEKRRHVLAFGRSAVAFSVAAVIVLILISGQLARIVGRPEYTEYSYLRFYFSAFVLISTLSLIPHFALFSVRRDRDIALASVAAIGAFFICWTACRSAAIQDAVPIAVLTAAAALTVGKTILALRAPEWRRQFN